MRTFFLICSKSFTWILLVWKHLKEISNKYEIEMFHIRKKKMFDFLRQHPFTPIDSEKPVRAWSLSDTRESQWWWPFLCFMAHGVQFGLYSDAVLGSPWSQGSMLLAVLSRAGRRLCWALSRQNRSPPWCGQLDVAKIG